MEAMDAIDKMIAELDREAKEKRQVITIEDPVEIEEPSARHESANKSSQTRRD